MLLLNSEEEKIQRAAEEFARANKRRKEYKGLADFLLHASADEQNKVFTEAARKANEDQMKVFKQAQMKTQANY